MCTEQGKKYTIVLSNTHYNCDLQACRCAPYCEHLCKLQHIMLTIVLYMLLLVCMCCYGSGADHFVHRFTHRVVRGVLLAVGRPDGR
jgi:hypothetical protein